MLHNACELNNLSDQALTARLRRCLKTERAVTAEVLRLIAEVDRRKLYLEAATSSMFDYVTRVLCMSEGSAYKRIRVARAGRRFPVIFELVAEGLHHLSGLALLVPHLTEENHRELLDAAKGLSKRQVEKLIATMFPRPDVKTSLRKLPQPAQTRPPDATSQANSTAKEAKPKQSLEATAKAASCDETQNGVGSFAEPSLAPKHVVTINSAPPPKPLSSARYLLKVTVSREVCEKLKQAQDLLQKEIPDRDLAGVLERALDTLIAERLKKKYAVREQPATISRKRKSGSEKSRRTRHIPAAVRRAVYQRDKGQCSFVDSKGRRCPARAGLQFHHHLPFGKGGQHTLENICLLCQSHNDYFARRDYGFAYIERKQATNRRDIKSHRLSPGTKCVAAVVSTSNHFDATSSMDGLPVS
jgi:hypothetical protein